MRFGKILLAMLVLNFLITAPIFSKTDDDQDYAVPAFSDLPLLNVQDPSTQRLVENPFREQLKPMPDLKQIQSFDINRDLQLNDFDVKQFQSIIENLHGEQLTGLQLSIRFKGAQKNQKESFPLLYDLDRDGMFTSYDVDYFSQLVGRLDEGATRGNELVQKLRLRIHPQESK